MKALVAVVVVAAMAGCSKPSCAITDVVGNLSDQTAVDCGAPTLRDQPSAFTAAHDCVVSAISAGRPFRVQWQQQGVDSEVYRGLVGTVSGATMAYYQVDYDSDPSGGSNLGAVAYTQSCSDLTDLGQCGEVMQTLCLDCTNPVMIARCQQ